MGRQRGQAVAAGRLDDLIALGRPGRFINGPGVPDERAKDSSAAEFVAWLKKAAKGAPLRVQPITPFGWKACGHALAVVRAADGIVLADLIFCPDAGGAAWTGYEPREEESSSEE